MQNCGFQHFDINFPTFIFVNGTLVQDANGMKQGERAS